MNFIRILQSPTHLVLYSKIAELSLLIKRENLSPSPPPSSHPSTGQSSKSARMTGAVGAFFFIITVVMDIVAGALGIQAEITQNKAKHITYLYILDYCRVPSHEAFKLGLAAAVILVITQVIQNLLGGCVCLCSKEVWGRTPTSNQLIAVACLFLSWITLVVGCSMLIIGALANSKSEETCRTSRSQHHFLLIGGILCFVHGLFSIGYYVSAKSADAPKTTRGEEEKRKHRAQTRRTERGHHGPHSQP